VLRLLPLEGVQMHQFFDDVEWSLAFARVAHVARRLALRYTPAPILLQMLLLRGGNRRLPIFILLFIRLGCACGQLRMNLQFVIQKLALSRIYHLHKR